MTTSTDYLIVGGGSAGCILARRLADANIGTVTLLEAGKSDEGDPALLQLSRLDEQTDATEWGFEALPIAGAPQRMGYSRARMLGGCGNHNDCAFIEPPSRDLDAWAALGASGWSAEALRACLDRVVATVGIETNPPANSISRAFIDAGRELGLPRIDYRRSVEEGVGLFPLNAVGDQRQAASQAYLHPLSDLPNNLTVRCETRATKLLFERGKAVGCQTDQGDIVASREVILTCGSIQTPHLLLVSGVGPVDQLLEQDIPVVATIPGIGMNLMDHTAANICHELKQAMPPWQLTPCEVVMMLNGDDGSQCPELLFHFVLRMREKYVDSTAGFAGLNGVKISPNVTRPRSRGRLRLESADITTPPHIDLNWFSDAERYDMRTLTLGLRHARRLAATPAFQKISAGEVLPGPGVSTDSQFEDYIRSTCETVYHPAGTCRMGDPDQPMTVVDPQLRVRGLKNLRICDASVFPSMVTVNINNAVMMAAEKAADMIIRNST